MLANLASAIKLRGLKRWQVAVQCGLSPSQFDALIVERRPLDPWLKEKLSQLLDADEEWLFQSLQEIPLGSPRHSGGAQ